MVGHRRHRDRRGVRRLPDDLPFGADHRHRDPASYIQFGQWLAGHGSLPIPQDNAAFGFSHDLTFKSVAYYEVGHSVVPQFMAGLPMVLAAGFWIGGASAAVLLAPILGACALLTFGGLTARLVGARWAPLATLALALALPLMFTSRSTYSEPMAAVLFLGGLCLVVDCLAADGRAARILSGLAGLALGLTFLVRLDGASDILPVIPYCGLMVVASRKKAWPMIIGFVVGAGYGLVDGVLLTWPYLQANMASVAPLAKIVLIVTALTVVAVVAVQSGGNPGCRDGSPYAAAALPVVIIAAFRPAVPADHPDPVSVVVPGGLPLAGISRSTRAVSTTRSACTGSSGTSASPPWSWAPSARRSRVPVRPPGAPAWTLPLLVFSWAIVSTLYRPAITPDQPWASRGWYPRCFQASSCWRSGPCAGSPTGSGPAGSARPCAGPVIGVCAAALVIPATITTFGLACTPAG